MQRIPRDMANFEGGPARVCIDIPWIWVIKTGQSRAPGHQNPEKAQIVHNVMLDELDIENLVKKMTEIYSYRVGGDPERKLIYEFNQQCTHLKIDDEDPRRCI